MSKITWERNNQLYTNSILGKVGKYQFFSIVWDNSGSNRDKPEKLHCRLPGIKDCIDNFATQEEAKQRAEQVFQLWLGNTGLTTLQPESNAVLANRIAELEKQLLAAQNKLARLTTNVVYGRKKENE